MKATGQAPKVFLVFSGQGAQWPGMGRELIEGDDYFRKDIESMDGVLQRLEHPPSWSITGEKTRQEKMHGLYRRGSC
jgi:acyl transferase domain-containing protein